jgi:hypothetical protein
MNLVARGRDGGRLLACDGRREVWASPRLRGRCLLRIELSEVTPDCHATCDADPGRLFWTSNTHAQAVGPAAQVIVNLVAVVLVEGAADIGTLTVWAAPSVVSVIV